MDPTLAALAIAASTARLDWLAGCWRSPDASVVTEECWTPPEGGLMLGTNRTFRDGKAVAFEFLRLADEGAHVVYWASPGGRSPATPFVLAELTPDRAVFVNPTHDFPERIAYSRTAGGLVVTVEGGGKSLRFDWARKIE